MKGVITKTGFSYGFNPSACSECRGGCCKGAGGNVWLSPVELSNISRHLDISEYEFVDAYTERLNNRLTLKERHDRVDGAVCILFDKLIGGCSVYESRPKQCRTFPFWSQLANSGIDQEECPGIIHSPRTG